MINITDYSRSDETGFIKYSCDECGIEVSSEVSIPDDSVRVVDNICPECRRNSVLYILTCKTESKSKELLSEFLVLKGKEV